MFFLFLLLQTALFADEAVYSKDAYDRHDNSQITANIDSYWYLQKNDTKRYLAVVGAGAVVAMIGGVAILWMLPEEVTKWDKSDASISNLGSRWVDNIKAAPVYDKDEYWLNYIAHPYWGAVYYMQGRNAGLGPFGSFMLSTFASAFMWEYGVEAFAEIPSIQDLFVTPIAGAFIGEGFFYASQNIKANDEEVLGSKALGWTLLTIMDPAFLIIEKTRLREYVRKDKTPDEHYSSWGVGNNNALMLRTTFHLN
ncbi:MAG: DUF3943 domain-containing protein [Alphaproteobacteria bacterium]|nr:DUF3943 domain-containing protein [Alphaproteobacteria bacterium]